MVKLGLTLLLVLAVSGCASYRRTTYDLAFADSRTGLPCGGRSVQISFVHELFPLNAPSTVRTNLNESGAVMLRLVDHAPTWVFLQDPGSPLYVFDLDLRSMERSLDTRFSIRDKHTGDCQLILTKQTTAR